MSYTKTQWNNDTAPAINATNLNKIEQGIYDNDTNVGDLTSLTTTADTDLVSAVNEVDSHADTNATNIGDLTTLTTTAKADLVSAINEVDSHADTNTTNIGTLSNLTTTTKSNLVSAVNEVNSHTVFTVKTWTTTLVDNQYVSPYGSYGYVEIPATDIANYGDVISASAANNALAPMPCFIAKQSNGTYRIILVSNTSNKTMTVKVVHCKGIVNYVN